jgi:hypothetical protein
MSSTTKIETSSSLHYDDTYTFQMQNHTHHQQQQNESNFYPKPVKPKSLINTTPLSTTNTSTTTTSATPCFADVSHTIENSSKRVKIRFLLFVEDSSGSRSNIFDSAKVNESQSSKTCNDSPSSPSQPPLTSLNTSGGQQQQQHQSPKLSNEMITRMVFGSFPMIVSNRTAIKVHNLKSSNMIMISNVFTYYKAKNNSFIRGGTSVKCSCQNFTAPTSATSSVLNTPTKLNNSNMMMMMGQNLKQNVSNDELSSCEADEKLSVNSFTEESLIFNASATTTPVKGNAIPILNSNSTTKLVTKIPASSFTNTSSKLSELKRGSTSYSLNHSYNLKDSLIKTCIDQYQILPNLPESNLILNESQPGNTGGGGGGNILSSGGGVMKRLMRSFSNSLSSTNTLLNLSGVDGESLNENKNNAWVIDNFFNFFTPPLYSYNFFIFTISLLCFFI